MTPIEGPKIASDQGQVERSTKPSKMSFGHLISKIKSKRPNMWKNILKKMPNLSFRNKTFRATSTQQPMTEKVNTASSAISTQQQAPVTKEQVEIAKNWVKVELSKVNNDGKKNTVMDLMKNPEGAKNLKIVSDANYTMESFNFLQTVLTLENKTANDEDYNKIIDQFIADKSPDEINISAETKRLFQKGNLENNQKALEKATNEISIMYTFNQ